MIITIIMNNNTSFKIPKREQRMQRFYLSFKLHKDLEAGL